MDGRETMFRAMMGPNLAWRLRRIGSISELILRIHRNWLRMGTEKGPGGSGGGDLEGERRSRKALRRRASEMVTRRMNQSSSMFLFFFC